MQDIDVSSKKEGNIWFYTCNEVINNHNYGPLKSACFADAPDKILASYSYSLLLQRVEHILELARTLVLTAPTIFEEVKWRLPPETAVELRAELQEKAAQQMIQKAEGYAEAFDVELGRIVEVDESYIVTRTAHVPRAYLPRKAGQPNFEPRNVEMVLHLQGKFA